LRDERTLWEGERREMLQLLKHAISHPKQQLEQQPQIDAAVPLGTIAENVPAAAGVGVPP